MTAFSTFLPIMVSAISFIWMGEALSASPQCIRQVGRARDMQAACAASPPEPAHLGQDHGRALLRGELVPGAQEIHLHLGVAILIDDLEGPRLHVLLDGGVVESPTDQSPVDSQPYAGVNRWPRGAVRLT